MTTKVSKWHMHRYKYDFTIHADEVCFYAVYKCRCGKDKVKMGWGFSAIQGYKGDVLNHDIKKALQGDHPNE